MKNALLFVCLVVAAPVLSQEKKEGKKKKLRELSPDRPHQTESPITVDAGHIMVETDLVNDTFYKNELPYSSTKGLMFFNFKVGLTNKMDVELMSNAYSYTKYEHNALPPTNNSFPDLTFRYKLNVLGNDAGRTAIAIMPFINTSNFLHEKWQAKTGGIFVNAEHMINDKFEIGYTGGLTSFTINPFFSQYELFSTVSFSYPVYRSINHFVEVSERWNSSSIVRNNYSIDSGFTFTPTRNNQFDMGFYYFIPVKTLYAFIGTTIRF